MNWGIILGLLVFCLAIWVMVLWLWRRKFTRERYAFYATGLIFTYAITIVTHMFADTSLLTISKIFLNLIFSVNIPIPVTPTFFDKLWSFAVLIFLMSFVDNMFRSWGTDGRISIEDNTLREINEELSFLRAAYHGMPFKKIETADNGGLTLSATNKKNFELGFLDQTRDWPSEVRELLQMYTQQYAIKENEWFNDQECFLSTYNKQPLLVICSTKMPSDDSILEKIDFFQNLSEQKKLKVILCLKEGDKVKQCLKIKGHEIECYTKELLLSNLVNFSEYNSYLNKQFYEDEISEGDALRLQDIYVESKAQLTSLNESDQYESITSVEKYLLEWASNKKNEEQIALLGDYGQGKSVLSLRFANELIKSKIERQPIIIELRGKSPRNNPMEDLVAAWARQFNYNANAILKLLQEGRLVVILEGFDELDMVGDKLRRLEHFKKLWEFAQYKKSKVIITGRPNLFLNNEEAREYLQLDNGNSSTFHFKALKLAAFDKDQIALALRKAPAGTKNNILEQYYNSNGSRGFADLISRPSILFQTSIIWDHLDKSNLNSSKIIDGFIDHAYRRQADKLLSISGTDLDPPVLTVKERAYFMLGIAVGLVKKSGYSNQILGHDLREIVNLLYLNIPDSCSQDHPISTVNLRERLGNDASSMDSVFNDVRAAGILVRDLTSNDSFKFAHKSFLETLFASFMSIKISREDEKMLAICHAIANSLNIRNIYNLEINDEVIGHITDKLIKHEKSFGDQEATALMNILSKRAAFFSRIFFRSRLIFIAWLTFISIIASVSFFLGWEIGLEDAFNGKSLESSFNDDLFVIELLRFSNTFLILIFLFSTLGVLIPALLRILAKKFRSPLKIWLRACEVQNYDINTEKVLSESFIDFVGYSKYSKINNTSKPTPLFNLIIRRK